MAALLHKSIRVESKFLSWVAYGCYTLSRLETSANGDLRGTREPSKPIEPEALRAWALCMASRGFYTA